MKTILTFLLLALPVLGQVYVPPTPNNNPSGAPTDTHSTNNGGRTKTGNHNDAD